MDFEFQHTVTSYLSVPEYDLDQHYTNVISSLLLVVSTQVGEHAYQREIAVNLDWSRPMPNFIPVEDLTNDVLVQWAINRIGHERVRAVERELLELAGYYALKPTALDATK